jgi:hypothetical protein
MPVDPRQAKEEIEAVFEKIPETLLEDFVSIGVFLSNLEWLVPLLGKLEADMQALIKERGGYYHGAISYFQHYTDQAKVIEANARTFAAQQKGQATGKPIKSNQIIPKREESAEQAAPYKHVLASVLETWEWKLQFQMFESDGRKKAQTYTKYVPPEQATKETALGRHWKDPGAGPNHGEFTHRIQWHLVARALAGGQLRLKNALPAVFKATGHITATGKKTTKLCAVWDAIVDRVEKWSVNEAIGEFISSDPNDARCPEILHVWLCKKGLQEVPLLSTFLQGRTLKRKPFATVPEYARFYIAAKKFKKPYEDLSEAERKQIEAVLVNEHGILRPGTPVVKS